MLTFKIDEKEYEVPEMINIDTYSKIFKIKDLLSDEYFAAKLVSIVSGAPVEDLMESDYEQINYLAAHILNLLPKTTPQFKDRFNLDGVEYGFFPNWRDLTYAEFVDMDTIATKPQEEMLNMLHILAAVMYRPIVNQISDHDFEIEKYDVAKMIKRSELFKKKLDVGYVLGAQDFFTKLGRRYLVYSQLSSIPKLTNWMKIKLVWKWRRIILTMLFKKRSVGLSSQTEFLEMILQSTITSIKRKSTKS
jgi:hypothetical protein